jgi:hypothetical protein
MKTARLPNSGRIGTTAKPSSMIYFVSQAWTEIHIVAPDGSTSATFWNAVGGPERKVGDILSLPDCPVLEVVEVRKKIQPVRSTELEASFSVTTQVFCVEVPSGEIELHL